MRSGALLNDLEYIEKIAREELRLVRPGEGGVRVRRRAVEFKAARPIGQGMPPEAKRF